MKKIDLHIHTVKTITDRPFTFSLDTFRKYVSEARLDAVAVTNHDVFDGQQFREIQSAVDAVVFPGIEVNVEKGHILVIGEPSGLADFDTKAKQVSQRITKVGDTISAEELVRIFGDLGNYLLIPHYEKGPAIGGDTLEKLKPHIFAGEVDSAKKFVRVWKEAAKLTPVLFSDGRMQADLEGLPTRQTFIDCGAVTLSAIKTCLRDRTKVALSEHDGNKLWLALPNGLKLSTGLNVVLGGRSTGKTHTLDAISQIVPRTKYIRQFELVQPDEAGYERDFKDSVARKRGAFIDDYLSGLKIVLDGVINIDLAANDRAVEQYVATLLKSAAELDRQDTYSKTMLFGEVDFPVGDTATLSALIRSVRQIIENVEFRAIIERHLDSRALKNLARELIELFWAQTLDFKKKTYVNLLVQEIKKNLSIRSSAVLVEDVDLYNVQMDAKRIQRFREIANVLKKEAVVSSDPVQGFRIETRKAAYSGASEIKDASRVKASFTAAFKKYGDPYEYLNELLDIEALHRADLHKLFVKIDCRILNKDGFVVSGGERSEFRLLEEIADAQKYDVLLIDEPESSFDNLFLKGEVNQLLKAIAATMPVVVVTHNNSVGASVGADYLLYTTKTPEGQNVVYRIYSGYPTDKQLASLDGKSISTHDILMNSLEAGADAYEGRREGYEALKN